MKFGKLNIFLSIFFKNLDKYKHNNIDYDLFEKLLTDILYVKLNLSTAYMIEYYLICMMHSRKFYEDKPFRTINMTNKNIIISDELVKCIFYETE